MSDVIQRTMQIVTEKGMHARGSAKPGEVVEGLAGPDDM